MLAKLFGSRSAELVLYYISVYEKGYATRISNLFGLSLNSVQKQLIKFEETGILVSFLEGRTRVFRWNHRYPFLPELQALLVKALKYLPDSEKSQYFRERTRPRRTGKPA
jgi:transcription initiation factor IIE alpha subunit